MKIVCVICKERCKSYTGNIPDERDLVFIKSATKSEKILYGVR